MTRTIRKRAVIGTLLRHRRAMSPAEVTEAILARRPFDVNPEDAMTKRRVAEILRYQTRTGAVVRISRGRYAYNPGSLSKSTIWRCLNWERRYDEEADTEGWVRYRQELAGR